MKLFYSHTIAIEINNVFKYMPIWLLYISAIIYIYRLFRQHLTCGELILIFPLVEDSSDIAVTASCEERVIGSHLSGAFRISQKIKGESFLFSLQ